MTEALRKAIRAVLQLRDQDVLDALVIGAAFRFGVSEDELAAELIAALDEQDEETQHWWNGPCNCHGRLN